MPYLFVPQFIKLVNYHTKPLKGDFPLNKYWLWTPDEKKQSTVEQYISFLKSL